MHLIQKWLLILATLKAIFYLLHMLNLNSKNRKTSNKTCRYKATSLELDSEIGINIKELKKLTAPVVPAQGTLLCRGIMVGLSKSGIKKFLVGSRRFKSGMHNIRPARQIWPVEILYFPHAPEFCSFTLFV